VRQAGARGMVAPHYAKLNTQDSQNCMPDFHDETETGQRDGD